MPSRGTLAVNGAKLQTAGGEDSVESHALLPRVETQEYDFEHFLESLPMKRLVIAERRSLGFGYYFLLAVFLP
jgi:hypothetical protein